jgi:hypothetical protein
MGGTRCLEGTMKRNNKFEIRNSKFEKNQAGRARFNKFEFFRGGRAP